MVIRNKTQEKEERLTVTGTHWKHEMTVSFFPGVKVDFLREHLRKQN